MGPVHKEDCLKIKIGGVDYSIVFDPTLLSKEDKFAESDFISAKIRVDPGSDDQIQEEAIMHEVFEVINKQHELHLPHRTITTLSNAWFQVQKDNRGIFNYNRG